MGFDKCPRCGHEFSDEGLIPVLPEPCPRCGYVPSGKEKAPIPLEMCPVCGKGEIESMRLEYVGRGEASSRRIKGGVILELSAQYDPDDDSDWAYSVLCSAVSDWHPQEDITEEVRARLRSIFGRRYDSAKNVN